MGKCPEGGGVTIISNLQGGKAIVSEIERALGIPIKHVPVRHGGSFGSKFSLVRYLVVLAYAAYKFKTPIKWVESRVEHLLASNSSGPERRFRIKAYFGSDGVVKGLDISIWEDAGASRSSGQAFKPIGILAGPYKIRNLRYNVTVVATNKNPAGAFRGAGTPPHTWALERVMDAIADELGMDRAEVRKRNLIDSFPYEAPYAYYDSGNPKGLLELALSRSDIFSLRDEDTGVGIAVSTDPSTPEGTEGIKLRIKGGKVVVGLGFGGEGQGYFRSRDGRRVSIFELGEEEVTYTYTAEAKIGRFLAYPFACDIAVVRYEDGRLRPIKHVVYLDPGNVIDEELVKEQVMGGTAIGISVALYEAYRYDEDGNLLTLSLGDYGLPTTMDIPDIEVHLVPSPSPVTPLGVKDYW